MPENDTRPSVGWCAHLAFPNGGKGTGQGGAHSGQWQMMEVSERALKCLQQVVLFSRCKHFTKISPETPIPLPSVKNIAYWSHVPY